MIELELIKDQVRHTLPSSDPSDDALLEQYERAAVEHVQRRCGRYYGPPVSGSFVAIGNDTSLLYLPERVTAVSSVTQRNYEGDSGTAILTGATDGWTLRILPGFTHSTHLVRRGGSIWNGAYEFVVAGTIGYPAGEEPYNVRQAVLFLASHFYINRIPVALGTVAPKIAHTVDDMLGTEIRIAV